MSSNHQLVSQINHSNSLAKEVMRWGASPLLPVRPEVESVISPPPPELAGCVL